MTENYYHAVPLNREMLSKFKSAMGISSGSNDVELSLNLHYQFGSASLLDFNSDVDFWVLEEVLPLNYLPFSYVTVRRGTDEVSVPYISAVRGHKGIYSNELVDKLAKQACGIVQWNS